MATTKVINMTARTTSNLAHDEYLYLTGETPDIDNKMPAAVLRDFVLSGIDPGLALTKSTTGYSSSNPVATLDLDVSELTALPSVDVTGSDYLVIEDVSAPAGSKSKKVLISALGPHVGDITDVVAGTNLNGGGATGSVTLNLDTTVTGLTSVVSTGFTGALTGNADTATTLATPRNISGVAFDGSADITLLMTGLGDVDGGMVPLHGQILTYDTTAPAGWTAKNVSGTGTVTSVGVSGTTGIVVDPATTPVTGAGTIALSLSGVPNSSLANSSLTIAGKTIALGGTDTIDVGDLDDVTITSIADDQFLQYDAASGLWKNETMAVGDITEVTAGTGLSGGGTTGAVTVNFDPDSLTLATGASGDKVAIADIDDSGAAKYVTAQSIADLGTTGDIEGVTAGTNLNGGGVSGTVTLNLDTVITGLTSVAATTFTGALVGNADTATALASTLGVTGGGTGLTAIAEDSVLVTDAANTLSAETATTSGHVLTYNGTNIVWAAPAASGDPAGTAVAMAIALGG